MNKIISAKTFILSHLALLIIGLTFFISLSIYLNPDYFKAKNLKDYLPVTTKPISFNLDINNPEDELLLFENSTLISGKTSPNATVVISSEDFDIGMQTNNQGEFSKLIELSEGINLIQITAFDQNGNSKEAIRTIYYSKEKL